MRVVASALIVVNLACGCSTAEKSPVTRITTTNASVVTSAAVSEPGITTELSPVTAIYPWGPAASSSSSDRLDGRFRSPPPHFTRVNNPSGSFGEFLRTLPLQAEGSPVVDYRGTKLYSDGHHPNIVAVADLDIGSKDLQQCADAIYRLNAEWRYGRGERDLTYHAMSGQALSYKSYMSGDRAIVDGNNIAMKRVAPAHDDDHAFFRGWLNDVFTWANTTSIERDAAKVSRSDLAPGDFFVMRGSPFGHAVLILDVAKDAKTGRTALLLGQSYMPAQSFQVLSPSRPGPATTAARDSSSPWFIIEPTDTEIATPFWQPFPISSLRRL